jgi:micrococcal nuclease
MGNHYAVRTQRAVFQEWKEAVPWAAAGQVTIANGGAIAKEMGGYIPEAALAAESGPAAPASGGPLSPPQGMTPATVESVVDGDTVRVRVNGQSESVRMIGIDTPEVVDPNSPVECFGREASEQARRLLPGGAAILLESDGSQGERDVYGRLLRYVWMGDGRQVNHEMVAGGYAFEYTYNAPYRYQAQFIAAERAADSGNRGLWSPTTCNGSDSPLPAPPPPAPPAPAPAPPAGNCHPSYPDVCIPGGPDLDCPQIPYRRFRVINSPLGYDPHGFDGDNDGIGCER